MSILCVTDFIFIWLKIVGIICEKSPTLLWIETFHYNNSTSNICWRNQKIWCSKGQWIKFASNICLSIQDSMPSVYKVVKNVIIKLTSKRLYQTCDQYRKKYILHQARFFIVTIHTGPYLVKNSISVQNLNLQFMIKQHVIIYKGLMVY